MKRIALLLATCALSAIAQKKTFEVASVKPSAPPGGGNMVRITTGSRFGPGTPEPTRWNCDNCTLMTLLTLGWKLKAFQIAGPAWLSTDRFDIAARLAEGATKDDLRLMQQSLLADRFGLRFRLEDKEMQVYDLVPGKNGPKLKESAAKPAAAAAPGTLPGLPFTVGGSGGGAGGSAPVQLKMGADGFPNFAADRTMTFTVNGNTKHQAVGEDMQQFSDMLSSQLDKPVTDATGLKGRYDFTLTFSGGSTRGPGGGGGGSGMVIMTRGGPGGGPGGAGPGGGAGGGAGTPLDGMETDSAPPLTKAVQDQLGLRLEAKKGVAVTLFIDKIERAPSEN